MKKYIQALILLWGLTVAFNVFASTTQSTDIPTCATAFKIAGDELNRFHDIKRAQPFIWKKISWFETVLGKPEIQNKTIILYEWEKFLLLDNMGKIFSSSKFLKDSYSTPSLADVKLRLGEPKTIDKENVKLYTWICNNNKIEITLNQQNQYIKIQQFSNNNIVFDETFGNSKVLKKYYEIFIILAEKKYEEEEKAINPILIPIALLIVCALLCNLVILFYLKYNKSIVCNKNKFFIFLSALSIGISVILILLSISLMLFWLVLIITAIMTMGASAFIIGAIVPQSWVHIFTDIWFFYVAVVSTALFISSCYSYIKLEKALNYDKKILEASRPYFVLSITSAVVIVLLIAIYSIIIPA